MMCKHKEIPRFLGPLIVIEIATVCILCPPEMATFYFFLHRVWPGGYNLLPASAAVSFLF